MTGLEEARRNHLLRAMPAGTLARWLPHLSRVDLPLGKALIEPGARVEHLVFPLDAIVSLISLTEAGGSAEVAVVGPEGVVGIAMFLGGGSMPNLSIVQSAGVGLRLPASVLMPDFNQGGVVMQVLLRYTQALVAQMAQTALCNRHHTLDQQLCRWILLSLDRLGGAQLDMTQDLIANMLGVRREGVTEAAGALQRAGLIQYRRGHITVLDRAGVEQRSCECYAAVRREYDRLLPPADVMEARRGASA